MVRAVAVESRRAISGAARAPISAHPAFPAVVALWFAALLGLGSLILPIILMERLVTVTGLTSLITSAAPPLGFTARATIALGAAIGGAVLGLLLARQVARSHAPKPRLRFASDDARQCRPISAHDELGEDGLGSSESATIGQKRRSLAMVEDDRKSDILQQYAPLPGQHSVHVAYEEPADDDPLELGDFAETNDADYGDHDQDYVMSNGTDFSPPRKAFDPPSSRQVFAPHANDQADEDEAFGGMPEDQNSPVDALPFSAPSLQRNQIAAQDNDEDEAYDDEPQDYGLTLPLVRRSFDPAPAAEFVKREPAPAPTGIRLAPTQEPDPMGAGAKNDQPLDSLGLVQLATRLGATLERRRARRAATALAAPARAPVFATAEEDFDAAAAEEAARARADFFGDGQGNVPRAFDPGPPPQNAQPFAPLSFDTDGEFEDDDLASSLSLPLKSKSAAPQFSIADTNDEDSAEDVEEDDANNDYSSLLAMKNPFEKSEEFVRVDEPEPEEDDEPEATVTFPPRVQPQATDSRAFDPPGTTGRATGRPSSADPAEADRELRAALATLQRMSGST